MSCRFLPHRGAAVVLLIVGAVAEVGGELAHVEEPVVEHHEEEADEEGGKHADEDVGEVPVVGRGLQAQAPEDHQQDVLNQHDAVERGCKTKRDMTLR